MNTANKTTSTFTTDSNTYYTIPPRKAEQGWECPRCGRINAPWVRSCDCSNKWEITCGDTTAGDEWWKQYVTCDSDTFKVHPESIVFDGNNVAVGGSDYWDTNANGWSNCIRNCTNKKEK